MTPWTAACQAPLSMGFHRQEYWSVLPFPSPGDLPLLEVKPTSPALTGRCFTIESPGIGLDNNCKWVFSEWSIGMHDHFLLCWGHRGVSGLLYLKTKFIQDLPPCSGWAKTCRKKKLSKNSRKINDQPFFHASRGRGISLCDCNLCCWWIQTITKISMGTL